MSANNGARPTVLIVEDFDDTRSMLKMMLEMSGYHVIEAINGQEAVDRARAATPDLILMDIGLPVLDGLSATRLIRQVEDLNRVPIVAVTANAADDLPAQVQAAGCDEYMPKPIDFGKLNALLSRYLPRA